MAKVLLFNITGDKQKKLRFLCMQYGITVLVEEDLEVSVDLASDEEVGSCDSAAKLRAFHQHILAGDVLLVVYSCLAEYFRNFHIFRGI